MNKLISSREYDSPWLQDQLVIPETVYLAGSRLHDVCMVVVWHAWLVVVYRPQDCSIDLLNVDCKIWMIQNDCMTMKT